MKREVAPPEGELAMAPAAGGGADASDADARSLRRSMLTNVLGAIPKLLYPLLLVFVVRAYGKSAFGLYTLLEATTYLALYLVTLGLDKGLLWWIPRQSAPDERRALKPVLLTVGAATLAGTVVLLLGGRAFIDLEHVPAALRGELGWDLALMALGLPPLAFMQLFVHALLAKRQLGAQVWVREALVSFVLMGAAWLAARLGHVRHGLGLAFLLSNAVGLVATLLLFRRHFRGSAWLREPWTLPRSLAGFALPLWLTGLVASLMARLDLYALALLADTATVGVYAAVLQLGKAVRSAHTPFGHMVMALASETTAEGLATTARARLVAGFSSATRLVTALLLPLFVFLTLFARPLLSLFGPGFAPAAPAAVILCGCWSLEGVLGLHGQVLMGLGRTRLGLLNMVVTLLVEGAALAVLVPRAGLSGAAAAVGFAAVAQSALQALELRLMLGHSLYDAHCVPLALRGCVAAGLALLAFLLLGAENAWGTRILLVLLLTAGGVATPELMARVRSKFVRLRT